MHSFTVELQGAAQAGRPAPAPTAPEAPAIPQLPATPGAPTGGSGGSGGSGGAATTSTERIVIDLPTPVVVGGQGGGGLAGTTSGTTPPFIPIDPNAIIREAIPLFGIMLSMVAVVFIGFPLARAFARRMDRRAEQGTIKASEVLPQIRQLQESVDSMAVELERISEAQRFQARLMSERPPAVLPHREGPPA